MDCSKVNKYLIFYIEGDLDDEKSRSVEEHLRLCPGCAALADMLKESLGVIEQEKKVNEDNDFATSVIARMDSEKKSADTPLFNMFRYAAAAAVIIFGVFTGINIAKIVSGSGDYSTVEISDEEYYLYDMFQEPIESFFLLKYDENE
jgi:anti-sigma factor RsiW